MLYPLVRPLLFAIDPERAHRLAIEALRASAHLPIASGHESLVELMGLRFPNRLGLAAGFDKNAEAVDGLGQLGFGFVEIGTVTLKPQRGQSRPRIFRLPEANALINRMGFPNDGATVVAARLRGRRYRGVIGVNIGKNANTPLERALDDYIGCLRKLHMVSDYVAVNISSPNTHALRDLHTSQRLEPLLSGILMERDKLTAARRQLPIVLKVSPDLGSEDLESVVQVLKKVSLDGVIATNTTVRRDGTAERATSEAGGLSGAPLHPISIRSVMALRRLLGPTFPIIGAGGVDSADKALAMRTAGADLVQLYTGLVFRGPGLVAQCLRVL